MAGPATERSPGTASTLDAGGVTTAYHDVGSGPPLLLVHGSGPGVSAWANWRTVIPVLAERHRVVAPDAVGFGGTPAPAGFAWGPEAWGRHLVDVLDALGLDQVSVVGNSFGGGLALWLATTHPERVRDLVLMGSVGVPFPITPGLDTVWGYAASSGVAGMRAVVETFAHDGRRLPEELVELRTRAAADPAVDAAYRSMFPAPRQRWVDRFVVDEQRVKELPHRTLLVHGRDDRVIPPSTSHRLHQLIENSELHVFGRCGHWVQIEAGRAFTDLVQNFLDRGAGADDGQGSAGGDGVAAADRRVAPPPPTPRDDAVAAAARRLATAAALARPCPPVRDLLGDRDVEAAYTVQTRGIAQRVAAGAHRVGRKVGLTNEAVQRQLGVGEPDFGVLLDDMQRSPHEPIDATTLLQPRIEPELAFVLGRSLDGEGPLDERTVRDAVERVVPALEIVDSRITGWDITIVDTVADNASSALFVLGDGGRALAEVEPAEVHVRMTRDGRTVSTGSGRQCLGDPITALTWLARTLRDRGAPLRAGEVVLSGALGPLVDVAPGDVLEAEFTGLGRVTARFAPFAPGASA